MRKPLLVIAGVLLVIMIAVYAIMYWPAGSTRLPPEELARLALEAPTPEEQEQAAVELAQAPPETAREHLRHVLAQSQTPVVRAACIQGLAALWDYESMTTMLSALEDQSPLVRMRAGAAVQHLLSADYQYRYDAPSEQRAATAKLLRERWEAVRDSSLFEKWKQRLKEEGS